MSNQWHEVSITTTGSCKHAVTAMDTAGGVLVKNATIYTESTNTIGGDRVIACSESMVFIPNAKLVPADFGQVAIDVRTFP